ncbi:MAG TPA: M28 family peptidase [Gemmatimonadales bacterium]
MSADQAPRTIHRAAPLLLAALAVAALGYAARRPPSPLPASAADSLYSAERAMVHVRAMAVRPHPMGTAPHDSVRDYVVGALRNLGLEPELQRTLAIGGRFPQAGRVENVLARLRGTGGGKSAVLLVAHYDGVGGALAAADDAAGTAVVLETLRALKAGPPLRHDVIALIADGEEAGLLGAAAFVQEHPWAGDVEVILNHEARGTGGLAQMFQTGPDNLDQIRVLRLVPDAAASSVSATVYRFLPNDTDLSELFALDRPALNFAFADGVERYHTSQDDTDHLDPRSLQHEGAQTLRLTRAFADGPLPRARSGNAVFFDLPLLGLVYYPEGWARPVAVLAAALCLWAFIAIARRERRWWLGLLLGLLGLLLTAAIATGVAYLSGRGAPPALGGRGPRGAYALGVAATSLGIAIGWYALARRWAASASLGLAALGLWTALAVFTSWRMPGLSFVVVWPSIAVAMAAAARVPEEPAWFSPFIRRLPAAITLFLLVPLLHGMGLVALGVVQGGLGIAAVTALAAWLLVGDLELVGGRRRWVVALAAVLAGAALVMWGRRTAGHDTEFPIRSLVAYAEAADDSTGWLLAPAAYADSGSWNLRALGSDPQRVVPDSAGQADSPPQWLTRPLGRSLPMLAARARRLGLEPPTATLLADSTTSAGRVLGYWIRPGQGVSSILMRVVGDTVLAASLDGRAVDRSRYRFQTPEWAMSYGAPPDSGFRLDLTLPATAEPDLELVSQRPGLEGIAVPARPASVVTSHSGDVRLVYRSLGLVPPSR